MCDAGLPIPATTARVDLALTHNVSTFIQVLSVITQEMQVEAAIVAQEIIEKNPEPHEAIREHLQQLEQHQGNSIALHYISHEAFKTQSEQSRAVFRSGECSPYANIILCAGVTF